MDCTSSLNSDEEAATAATATSSCYPYSTVSSAPPKRRAGRTKFRETRHPVYKGVRMRGKNGDRWVCELRDPNDIKSRIWLGTFPTPEMAARAHDVAAMALRGPKACLNFADSAWRLAIPETGDHKDIRDAAAAAAEMFRPTTAGSSDDHLMEGPLQSETPALELSLFDMIELDIDLRKFCHGFSFDAVAAGGHHDDLHSTTDISLWSHSD